MSRKILGIIAGRGKFPILFAKEAKSQGYQVVVGGVKGDASFLLKFFSDQFQTFHVGDLKKLIDFFKEHQVKDVIMAGQVSQSVLFDGSFDEADEQFKKLFAAIQDRRADTIFSAVGDVLKIAGLELRDSTFLLKKYLAPKGVLTKRSPNEQEASDIDFGCQLAKAMGQHDIGQTVVVKDKAIVAVEAMEGTDQTILRGGEIAQNGAVVVKMSKPDQDFRFDVPVIGPRTIKKMAKSNCSCLVIEAQKTLLIDQKKLIKQADFHQISIISQ